MPSSPIKMWDRSLRIHSILPGEAEPPIRELICGYRRGVDSRRVGSLGAGAASHRRKGFFYQGGLRLDVPTRRGQGPVRQCGVVARGAALEDTASVVLLCAGAIGCPVCLDLRYVRMDPKGHDNDLCHYALNGKLGVLEEFSGEYVTPVLEEFLYGRSDGQTS